MSAADRIQCLKHPEYLQRPWFSLCVNGSLIYYSRNCDVTQEVCMTCIPHASTLPIKCLQGVQFFAFVVLFLAYMSVAVYGNNPEWNTQEMLGESRGQAAVVLECILMVMMFGQVSGVLACESLHG
eukprot:GHUV01032070.1.p1 GENE.GHUV01032070.1~~GHUV01032070.1.p1  ORF type:complete len:126 (-),score=14.95 GHUV01032070.1:35-412(-)